MFVFCQVEISTTD